MNTLTQLNTMYFQRPTSGAKLPAADAILTPKSVDKPAYLLQITVSGKKKELSTAGVQNVEAGLKAFYSRLASQSKDVTKKAAWLSKSSAPIVLYMVSSDVFVSFHPSPLAKLSTTL